MKNWLKELPCAVTVCDLDTNIVYMNDRSCATFAPNGESLIGTNLMDCHAPASRAKIEQMLAAGTTNSYTIEKNGVKKIIHQMPWYENGVVGGLIELSIVLPDTIVHKVRL